MSIISNAPSSPIFHLELEEEPTLITTPVPCYQTVFESQTIKASSTAPREPIGLADYSSDEEEGITSGKQTSKPDTSTSIVSSSPDWLQCGSSDEEKELVTTSDTNEYELQFELSEDESALIAPRPWDAMSYWAEKDSKTAIKV